MRPSSHMRAFLFYMLRTAYFRCIVQFHLHKYLFKFPRCFRILNAVFYGPSLREKKVQDRTALPFFSASFCERLTASALNRDRLFKST